MTTTEETKFRQIEQDFMELVSRMEINEGMSQGLLSSSGEEVPNRQGQSRTTTASASFQQIERDFSELAKEIDSQDNVNKSCFLSSCGGQLQIKQCFSLTTAEKSFRHIEKDFHEVVNEIESHDRSFRQIQRDFHNLSEEMMSQGQHFSLNADATADQSIATTSETSFNDVEQESMDLQTKPKDNKPKDRSNPRHTDSTFSCFEKVQQMFDQLQSDIDSKDKPSSTTSQQMKVSQGWDDYCDSADWDESSNTSW